MRGGGGGKHQGRAERGAGFNRGAAGGGTAQTGGDVTCSTVPTAKNFSTSSLNLTPVPLPCVTVGQSRPGGDP